MMILTMQNNGDPAAGIAALLVLLVLGLAGLAFYFLPTIVATTGKHPQTAAIFVLNLLTGWTFIGWVVAIVWAFVQSQPKQVVYVQQAPPATQRPTIIPPDNASREYNYRRINQ